VYKVRLLFSTTWDYTYVCEQIVQKQKEFDDAVYGLVLTLEETFDFVEDADLLQRLGSKVQKETLGKILKQTIECAYYVRDYSVPNFRKTMIHAN
jgi:hypothetical protein